MKENLGDQFGSWEEFDYWVDLQNAIWIAEEEEFINFKKKRNEQG